MALRGLAGIEIMHWGIDWSIREKKHLLVCDVCEFELIPWRVKARSKLWLLWEVF
jgi:hypothetical protein